MTGPESDQVISENGWRLHFDDGALLYFNLEARQERDGGAVEALPQAVYLVVDVNKLAPELKGCSWFFAYEQNGWWFRLETHSNEDGSLVYAQTDHLSPWTVGVENAAWVFKWNEPVVSEFSGAASSSYPIEVPAGRGGLQPDVNLYYSSRGADLVTFANSDQGAIGLGWSINSIEISREGVRSEVQGANTYIIHPDLYSLVINGAGYELKSGEVMDNSPYLNRWIQPDTIIPDPANPQSLNRYSYVYNRPVNMVDSSGHYPMFAFSDGSEGEPLGGGGSGPSTKYLIGLSLLETAANLMGMVENQYQYGDLGNSNNRAARANLALEYKGKGGFEEAQARTMESSSTAGRYVPSAATSGATQVSTPGVQTDQPIGNMGLRLGSHHSQTQWDNRFAQRGWTNEQIEEAFTQGEQFPAPNYVHPGNTAIRYVHPTTGRWVVVDVVTNEVLMISKDGMRVPDVP